MVQRGTAPYNLGQFAQVNVAITTALPRALVGTDPKKLIPLLGKSGEELGGRLGELLRSLQEGVSLASKAVLLESIDTVTIPARAERFAASEQFVLNYGPKTKPGVLISYLGDNFKQWFLGKVEEPLTKETTLRYAKLVKSSVDGPILAELGDKAETTLAQIYALLELQKNGEGGVLLTNGWANIFYVNGRAVDVYWLGDGWHVDAYSVTGPDRWDDGLRVFSRNSQSLGA